MTIPGVLDQQRLIGSHCLRKGVAGYQSERSKKNYGTPDEPSKITGVRATFMITSVQKLTDRIDL